MIHSFCALPALAFAFGGATAQQTSFRDSAGIRIVTSSAPSWTQAQALRFDPTPVVVIGTQPGVPYELARVAGAARLSDGRYVIADGGSLQLRFYDANGRHLESRGGRGGGPGEFQDMMSMARLRGDTLVVTPGPGMVHYLDGSGNFIRTVNLYAPPPVEIAGRFKMVMAAFANGTTVVGGVDNPAPRTRGARWIQTMPVAFVGSDHTTIRALGDLPAGEVVMEEHPSPPWFGAPLSFAATDDAFYIGLGTEYSIRMYARDGRLVRIIRRAWAPAPVTRSDIETYVVEWGRRWIKSTGAEAERERADLRDDPYASTVPAFSRFITDRVGRLWVRAANLADAPGAGQLNLMPLAPSVWSVFGDDGAWLGDVTLPARFQPHDIGADYVVGIARDADDVQTLVHYRLRAGR